MTTGNRIIDNRSKVDTACGPGTVGSFFQRNWNGADSNRPKVQKFPNYYKWTVGHYNTTLIKWGPQYNFDGTIPSCFGGPSQPSFSESELDDLRQSCLSQVMSKYKTHDFNLAVFLGELPDTIRLVTNSALSVFEAYRLVRKGRFRQALRRLRETNLERGRDIRVDKEAASNWLALRYGWLPLINDAYAAADAYEAWVQRNTNVPRPAVRGRRYLKKPMVFQGRDVGVGMARHQVILCFSRRPDFVKSLGLLDPALVAWELVPFSFVIDWFVGVGDYLELRANLPRVGAVYITTESQSTSYENLQANNAICPPGNNGRTNHGERRISSLPDIPLPRLKNPLGPNPVTRLFDAAALTRALIK